MPVISARRGPPDVSLRLDPVSGLVWMRATTANVLVAAVGSDADREILASRIASVQR
jgi:hypothetical protein